MSPLRRAATPVVLVALLTAAAPILSSEAPRGRLLEPVTHAEWQQVLAGLRGEIVVVDFWATWCLPCIERFPKMVELAERYSDDGVTFLAFSLDDRKDAGAMERAESFAGEQGGRIAHYVTSESITRAFEQLDLLGIPAVKVYARDGSLGRTLDLDDPADQFTDEDVEEAIRDLLRG